MLVQEILFSRVSPLLILKVLHPMAYEENFKEKIDEKEIPDFWKDQKEITLPQYFF